MTENVFINYRRQTESGLAGRIYDSLRRELPGISMFMDVDKLNPGDDFEQGLERSLASCKVLLALVGPDWLTQKNGAGVCRLDDPQDFVRRELRTALSKNVRIIPVLVNGARMPDTSELPDDIKGFGKRQAMEIRHERYNADVRDLAQALAAVVPGARATTRKYAKLGVAALALAAVAAGAYYLVWSQWLSWSDQAHYQLEFDRQLLRQYYPAEVEARVNGDAIQYRGTFVPFPNSKTFQFYSRHSIPDEEFKAFDEQMVKQGYQRIFHQEIAFQGRRYHQGTWVKL
jgi:hypothetical protein